MSRVPTILKGKLLVDKWSGGERNDIGRNCKDEITVGCN